MYYVPAASPRAIRAEARRLKSDCKASDSELRVARTAAGAAHGGPPPVEADTVSGPAFAETQTGSSTSISNNDTSCNPKFPMTIPGCRC